MKDEPTDVGEITPEIMKMYARILTEVLPEGVGFSLLLFDFGDTLREFKYISNAQRGDMIESFRALLAKWDHEAEKN